MQVAFNQSSQVSQNYYTNITEKETKGVEGTEKADSKETEDKKKKSQESNIRIPSLDISA